MLFILTGDIQIGKTRWLQRQVADLEQADVPCAGVLAPGVWRPCSVQPEGALRAGARRDDPYEKLGIDNVLLPGGERVHFARRRDLALKTDGRGMGWVFDAAALACVNGHFARLEDRACAPLGPTERPGLLVVDELGRLELLRGAGLTHAMSLLDSGPTPRWPHAIVVVRETLVPIARRRFGQIWGDPVLLSPDSQASERLQGAFA